MLAGSLGESTMNLVPLPTDKLIIADGSYWSPKYRVVSNDLADYASATVRTPPPGGFVADTGLIPSRTPGSEGYIFLTIDSPYQGEASYNGTDYAYLVRYELNGNLTENNKFVSSGYSFGVWHPDDWYHDPAAWPSFSISPGYERGLILATTASTQADYTNYDTTAKTYEIPDAVNTPTPTSTETPTATPTATSTETPSVTPTETPTVQILQTGAVMTSTVSGDDGSYRVGGLLPGNYRVALMPLPDFVTVPGAQQAVVLTADSAVNVGFGLQPVSTSVGSVYADGNGDGVRQFDESGLTGATVALLTAGPDGVFRTGDEVTAASTSSAVDGSYSFVNQAVGAYAVQLTAPAGYTTTSPSEVVVNLAQFRTAVANFGNQPLNTVVASTFEDQNNNGVQDEDCRSLSAKRV